MTIKENRNSFLKAKVIFDDILFKANCDKNNSEDIKNIKLLQAREYNLDFETQLSDFICGEPGNSFPYRSSYYLTKFFKDLGLNYTHNGSTRRFWVKEVLQELNISQISFLIEKGLFNKKDFKLLENKKANNYENSIQEFRLFINDCLNENSIDLSYLLELNINVELLFDNQPQTKDEELNKLIKEAKDRFFIPQDKQVAIEKLWDAFERIKTYFGTDKKSSSNKLISLIAVDFSEEVINEEFKILTKIGNEFRIRHHETDKKDIIENKHLNYLFFRMLSLLDLCLITIKKNGQNDL